MSKMIKLPPKLFQQRIDAIQDISLRYMWLVFYTGFYIFTDKFLNKGIPSWLGILVIVALSVVSGLIYHLIRNIVVAVYLHIAVFGVFLIWGNIKYDLISSFIITVFLLLLVSLVNNILGAKRGYISNIYSVNPLFVMLLIVYEVYAIYSKLETFYILGFVVAVLFMAGHFWCTYIQGLSAFMGVNMKLVNVPRADMYKSNSKIVALIITIFFLVTGFAYLLRYTSFFSGLGALLGIPVKKGLEGILIAGSYIKNLISQDKVMDAPPSEPVRPAEVYVSNDFMNGVAVLVSLVILVFIIAWLVCFTITKKKPKHVAKIIAGEKADEVEELTKTTEKKRSVFKDNNEKIRAMFKRWIKKNLKPHVPKGKTARELSDIAINNITQSVKVLEIEDSTESFYQENAEIRKKKELARLYDVARYSGRMLTDEELKSVK